MKEALNKAYKRRTPFNKFLIEDSCKEKRFCEKFPKASSFIKHEHQKSDWEEGRKAVYARGDQSTLYS